jgi:aminoglycoside phosphotransferase (APT) family kinase protein
MTFLRAFETATRAPLVYAEKPVALDHPHGPWAFQCRLRRGSASGTGQPTSDDRDEFDLVVRLAPERASVEREAAVMRLVLGHGGGATAVHAVVALENEAGDQLWALASEPVTGIALPELIGFNLQHSDDLLRGFAVRQADIHGLPLDDLGPEQPVPVVRAGDEIARIDGSRLAAERRWLEQQLHSSGELALCHGGYQPMSVFGPPPEEWETNGGPGTGLVAVNWCGAVLAEPEFDVAYTLVALWSAPYFAKNRAERTAIKMIRNTLVNTYKLGYGDARELSWERVRFWEAFHVLRGIARFQDAYDPTGSPFLAGDRGRLPDELETELPRRFRQLTRVR